MDCGLGGLAGDLRAARGGTDALHGLAPAVLVRHEEAGRAEVARQFEVGLPVSDDEARGHVVVSFEIFAEHARAGLPGGEIVFRETPVYQEVVEEYAFALEGAQHLVVRGPEGALGEGGRAEAVLVGGHDEFVAEAHEGPQRGDGSGDEFELLERIDLLVVRLDDYRSVPIDEYGFLFHMLRVI